MNLRKIANFFAVVLVAAAAPASQEQEGQLREQLTKALDTAADAVKSAAAAQQEAAKALADAGTEKAVLRAQIVNLTTTAQTNLEASTTARLALADVRESRNFWLFIALALIVANVGYVLLRLHPATSRIIP